MVSGPFVNVPAQYMLHQTNWISDLMLSWRHKLAFYLLQIEGNLNIAELAELVWSKKIDLAENTGYCQTGFEGAIPTLRGDFSVM
jgi:hypothetical protein